MHVDDNKLSQLFSEVDSYIVSMTFFAEIRCYITIFTIRGTFAPKKTFFCPHLSTSIMYMNVDDNKLSQMFVGVESYMVSMTCLPHKVLYTNFHNLGPFWPQKIYFLSPSVHQYHLHACRWCQIVQVVFASWLIYSFNDFLGRKKVRYTNLHNLGHFRAPKDLISVPICPPV